MYGSTLTFSSQMLFVSFAPTWSPSVLQLRSMYNFTFYDQCVTRKLLALSRLLLYRTGLFGYFRRGLIDLGSAVPFIAASLPACLLGALIVPYADERVLKGLYAVFMLSLSVYLLLDEQG